MGDDIRQRVGGGGDERVVAKRAVGGSEGEGGTGSAAEGAAEGEGRGTEGRVTHVHADEASAAGDAQISERDQSIGASAADVFKAASVKCDRHGADAAGQGLEAGIIPAEEGVGDGDPGGT